MIDPCDIVMIGDCVVAAACSGLNSPLNPGTGAGETIFKREWKGIFWLIFFETKNAFFAMRISRYFSINFSNWFYVDIYLWQNLDSLADDGSILEKRSSCMLHPTMLDSTWTDVSHSDVHSRNLFWKKRRKETNIISKSVDKMLFFFFLTDWNELNEHLQFVWMRAKKQQKNVNKRKRGNNKMHWNQVECGTFNIHNEWALHKNNGKAEKCGVFFFLIMKTKYVNT